MEIVLLRHGRAEERAEFARTGREDGERPLTADGRRRLNRAVRGLRRILPPPALIASSPLVRARQSARIVAAGYGGEVVQWPELAPGGDPSAVIACLPVAATALLVGHEPDLGALGSWLLSGADGVSFLSLKKGGACCIACAGRPAAGGGRLRWLLTPRQLRTLGK